MFKLFGKRKAPRFLAILGDKGESYVYMRRNTADWNNHETVCYISPDTDVYRIREYEFHAPPVDKSRWREATEDEINKLIEDFMIVYKQRFERSIE